MGIADDLAQLREGSMLDYDMQTWEVTAYESHSDAGWPADEWTLESGTDVRFLEHDYNEGDVFRLSKPAKISKIAVHDYHGKQGEPFLTAIREEDAPGTIMYKGEKYVLAEEDARVDTSRREVDNQLATSETDSQIMGVCGGIAEHTGWSSSTVRLGVVGILLGSNFLFPCVLMPVVAGAYFLLGVIMPDESGSSTQSGRTHYWVYQKGDEFVALECLGSNDWNAYAGREVEPYEFDNLLPGKSAD